MNKRKWSLRQQGTFLVRLGDLLEKGYSLSQALEFLEMQQPLSHRRDLQRCLEHLRSGLPFYRSLDPLHFHREAIGYLFFAEQHGDLPHGIAEAGKMLLHKADYLQRLRKTSSYPLLLLLFMVMMLAVVQHMLLPQFFKFSTFLTSSRSSFTSFFLQIVSTIPDMFIVFCILLIVCLLLYVSWFQKLTVTAQIHIVMKIPLIRSFARLYFTHMFAMQLRHLLQGGLSIYEALQVFARQEKLPFLQEEGKGMKEQLVKGITLDAIIASRMYYEQELALVVRHGQSNGELAKELSHYGEFIFQTMEERIERSMKFIQPILLSFVGVLVICMYLAILLPMFSMMSHL
ncbi:competence-related pilin export protein ComGB [Parageobacillus thermantarcticus]|uniref:Competence-related pilin export protein ComGB n=1 Tax=Parageobacillus thermantarcticus TaxID=186116 RepID=A0A1I0T000_9BACL|nr:competence type IV pilus assembly protein ComGB [Parageobacillus thermantarcticus]SFA45017.1 competence-related pilin export protein ComGB [Parageobacillus thermantarcticus]